MLIKLDTFNPGMSFAKASFSARLVSGIQFFIYTAYVIEAFGEKCGVAGVITTDGQEAAPLVAKVLFAEQHRGPAGTGIVAASDESDFHSLRLKGKAGDVYNASNLAPLIGNRAIGHDLYSTVRSKKNRQHLQPFEDEPYCFAIAHNGTFPITTLADRFLSKKGVPIDRFNDTERFGLVMSHAIRQGKDLPDSIRYASKLVTGAASCVVIHDGVIAAFRDSHGIRPLAMGKLSSGGTVFASETCGLDILKGAFVREVEPGEIIIATADGKIETQLIGLEEPSNNLDIFEMIYFARPDSYLYGQRVNQIRKRIGQELALLHPLVDKPNTVVMPVPDTAVPAAEGYSDALGLSRSTGIIKNRYIDRTFIAESDELRQEALDLKFNIVSEEFAGKHVIIIDDSLVRGNTMPPLVAKARECGAQSIAVLFASPPVRFSDFHGIDTKSQDELIAANLTINEIRHELDCDYLGFLTLQGLLRATQIPPENFSTSCFTGIYPTSIGKHARHVRKPVSMEYIDY